MPTPWSIRMPQSSNSYNSTFSNAHGDVSTSSRVPAPSQITDYEIAAGGPALDPLSSKPLRTPSRHGRSVSHPFPALFSSVKKKRAAPPLLADDGTTSFDHTDDEILRPSSHQNAARVPDKDLATGHCMTCNSSVKWPKELVVFRCSVCMTINDLKAGGRDANSGSGKGKQSPRPILKVPPLSVQRTEQIIRRCLDDFLLGVLHPEKSGEVEKPDHLDRPVERREYSGDSETSDRLCNEFELLTVDDGTSGRRFGGHDKTIRSKSFSTPADGEPVNVHPKFKIERKPLPPTAKTPLPISPGAPSMQTSAPQDALSSSLPSNGWDSPKPVVKDDVFKLLEDYITNSFRSLDCINNSFPSGRPFAPQRTRSASTKESKAPHVDSRQMTPEIPLSTLDAKTLLIGDIAENGLWWTGTPGRSNGKQPVRSSSHRNENSADGERLGHVSLRSPHINWADLQKWYATVFSAGQGWRSRWDNLLAANSGQASPCHREQEFLRRVEEGVLESQASVRRILLKATESLLKRPGQPLKQPEDIRFLLILLSNPLLFPGALPSESRARNGSRSRSRENRVEERPLLRRRSPSRTAGNPAAQHSGILKRILGLISNLPNECHHHLVQWFSGFQESHFRRITELIGSFVTYRLTRQHGRRSKKEEHDPISELIPTLGSSSSVQWHDALDPQRSRANSKKADNKTKQVQYDDDWQIKAAARVMSILFTANSKARPRRFDSGRSPGANGQALDSVGRAHHGKFMDVSDFYNTLLDYSDLISDFEAWEAKKAKFAFCQYPFFLSIWAKIQIMEYDTRRQMETKAREAFFNSILRSTSISQYMVLKVRRECLVEDSLRGVSEVLGAGGEDIKKGLRIEFTGEEGVDAGGLRKEWFLLLVRDVFNPEHGLFTYDEDSQYCYFNPNSFETSDQYFLVGVVLGLAIYNSTILDVALPPFAYRKLLAGGPAVTNLSHSISRPSMNYTLDDLAEFRPALASGLHQLLEFDGDVENTFCRDFVADVDKYGQSIQIPLCPNGENTPVTNSNRRTFVDLYIRYLLDTSVARQFEPFKRGFFTVCGGNALSLFQPEEIEKLIRGSEEALDISSLRAVAVYENWHYPPNNPNKKKINAAAPDNEPVIRWFWETFEQAEPRKQRKLLSFITGSDRIPAMGATSLVIKITCLGNDGGRFPTARTCFNTLGLWRYGGRERLVEKLWRAVEESEGFGLK